MFPFLTVNTSIFDFSGQAGHEIRRLGFGREVSQSRGARGGQWGTWGTELDPPRSLLLFAAPRGRFMRAAPAVFPLLCRAQAWRGVLTTHTHIPLSWARLKAGCRAGTTESLWVTVLMLSPSQKREQRRLADSRL